MWATFHYLFFVHLDEEPHFRLHQFCCWMSLQMLWLVVVEVVMIGLVVEAAVEAMFGPAVEPVVGPAVMVVVSQ